MAKRDGWQVTRNLRNEYRIENNVGDRVTITGTGDKVHVYVHGEIVGIPLARAIQFAAKVQEIAARAANKAAKEAKRERDGAERAEKGGGDGR